jgi:dCMP deaminase
MKDSEKLFLKIATLFAEKSTCDRAKVGCVLVKDGRIISTGFNGSISKQPHCDDAGHLMIEGHCVRTIHAEQNALMFCAKKGISTEGAEAYSTHNPCPHCLKLLIQAGIKKAYYCHAYRMDENPFNEFMQMEQVILDK